MEISKRLTQKAVENHIPIISAFELLPICNLSCKMCYVRKSKEEVDQQGGLLSTKQWLKIAEEAKNAGLLFPLLTGGEPFLRNDIKEIIEGMQNLGLQISINTNATLIDEEMAKWLSTHRPTRMNITLYGASEDTYQKLCGNGKAYHKVKSAVKLLKDYQIPIKFNVSITPYNVHEMKEMIEYGHSLGSPVDVVTYMFPPVRRDEQLVGKNDRLTPQQAGLARVQADFYQREPQWFIGQAHRYSRFMSVTDDKYEELSKMEPHEMACRAGRCSFWIDWQGNMRNCGMYSSVKVSLTDKNFLEAWDEIVEKTREIRYSPVCTNCPNYRLCHTCISMIYNECGNIDGRPKYICEMNEAAAKYYKLFLDKLMNEGKIDEKKIIDEKVNFDDFDISDDCDMH
ncbi:MAG: radical SAM/SPASM domain-containing protein [Faecalibacillus sp.]